MRHGGRCYRSSVKLLIRPATPTGPGRQLSADKSLPGHEASHQSGSRCQPPTTAQHHQGCKAILTVTQAANYHGDSLAVALRADGLGAGWPGIDRLNHVERRPAQLRKASPLTWYVAASPVIVTVDT